MASPGIRSAQELPRDVLWELLGTVRQQLSQRGEILPAAWVDETVEEIHRGNGRAWAVGEGARPTGLGLLWIRAEHAIGHLHASAPEGRVETLAALTAELVRALPTGVERLDVGATGMAPSEESALGERLVRAGGFRVILRESMLRPLAISSPPPEPVFPSGVTLTTAHRVPLDELALLDARAYQGTPDESLISNAPAGNREMLAGALAGRYGTFLEDASPAVRDASGELLGFAIGCEESLQAGILIDLAVEPAIRRKGIGRALLWRALRAFLALGYLRAHLWVTEANGPARALYDKAGFRRNATAAIYRWTRTASPGSGALHRQSER